MRNSSNKWLFNIFLVLHVGSAFPQLLRQHGSHSSRTDTDAQDHPLLPVALAFPFIMQTSSLSPSLLVCFFIQRTWSSCSLPLPLSSSPSLSALTLVPSQNLSIQPFFRPFFNQCVRSLAPSLAHSFLFLYFSILGGSMQPLGKKEDAYTLSPQKPAMGISALMEIEFLDPGSPLLQEMNSQARSTVLCNCCDDVRLCKPSRALLENNERERRQGWQTHHLQLFWWSLASGFLTCCCPCVTFGRIAEIVDRGFYLTVLG